LYYTLQVDRGFSLGRLGGGVITMLRMREEDRKKMNKELDKIQKQQRKVMELLKGICVDGKDRRTHEQRIVQ